MMGMSYKFYGEEGHLMKEGEIELENRMQGELCATYLRHLEMLIEKNKRYGNSALEPLNIFYDETSQAGLLVRIDDKLNRVKTSKQLKKNDIADLVGYLMLLMVKCKWSDFDDLLD